MHYRFKVKVSVLRIMGAGFPTLGERSYNYGKEESWNDEFCRELESRAFGQKSQQHSPTGDQPRRATTNGRVVLGPVFTDAPTL